MEEILLDPQEFANFIMVGRAGKRVTVANAFQKYMEKEGRRAPLNRTSCFVLRLLLATVGQREMSNADMAARVRRLNRMS